MTEQRPVPHASVSAHGEDAPTSRTLVLAHRLAVACALTTLLMIFIGAMVTTTKAGDTDPTWSWRFWEWIGRLWGAEGGLAYELGHRVIGTVIGVMMLVLAALLWRAGKGTRGRLLAFVALGTLIAQGIVGGVRVLVVSDPHVQSTVLGATGATVTTTDVEVHRAAFAMVHGVLAQVTFTLMMLLALVTSPVWRVVEAPTRSPHAGGTRALTITVVVLLLVQLALGTYVRQTRDGVMWHVAGAFAVTLTLVLLAVRIYRLHGGVSRLASTATAILLFLVAQVFLGVAPWMWTHGVMMPEPPTSMLTLMRCAHVVTGALIFAFTALLALWAHRLLVPGQGNTPPGMTDTENVHRDAAPGHARGSTAPHGELQAQACGPATVSDYLALFKVRIGILAMAAVAVGYLLGSPRSLEAARLFHDLDGGRLLLTLVGVVFLAAGTAALNQYIERDLDARMERTRNRPIPAGRIPPRSALNIGLTCTVLSVVWPALFVNAMTALVSAAIAVTYLCVYTPLKTRTTFAALVGAVPGALPPVLGWTAATVSVSLGALVLFSILFVWQLPHFWAIAWFYRKDYAAAGMQVLSVWDRDGAMMGRQIGLWTIILIAVSLLPLLIGMSGGVYGWAAVVLGLMFLGMAVCHVVLRSRRTVRGVFFVSLIYLPCLLLTMLIDRW